VYHARSVREITKRIGTDIAQQRFHSQRSRVGLPTSAVSFVRGFLRFGGTATPTKIEVIDVVEYKNYKFYQVSGAPSFVDKVYMINLALTYGETTQATKVATEIPMITIENVRNKAYFFTVYLVSGQPTLYPSPTFLP
jgi:hypothetical protein